MLGHYALLRRKKIICYHGQGLCSFSLHYPSDRATMFRCANTIIYIQGIPGSYGYRSLEIIYYVMDIQAPTDIPAIQLGNNIL